MRLVLRALRDPAFEQILLRGRKLLVAVRGGHAILRVGSENAGDEFAFIGLTRNDHTLLDGNRSIVEPQFRFAMAFVGAMAAEAVVREDGADVAVELNFLPLSLGQNTERDHGANGPLPQTKHSAVCFEMGRFSTLELALSAWPTACVGAKTAWVPRGVGCSEDCTFRFCRIWE